jgi:hypothetical protein
MTGRIAALVLALQSAGCAAMAEPLLLVEPEDFRSRVRYVALHPVEVELELESAEEPARRIEAELASRLEAAGFRVLPAEVLRGIRARMAREVESVPGADGARPDQQRRSVIDDYSTRELLADHPVDALVRPSLVAVAARVYNTRAMWDGTSQKLLTFRARLLTVSGMDGSVRAMSLRIAFHGRDGQLLYARRGGIALLARLSSELKGMEKVPETELWQDAARVSRAVDYAIGPLRDGD